MIAHMSEAKVVLKNDETVTLFCVSSTHCWNSEYDWTCDAEPTGVSSPVLYAKRPGNYQCVVTLHSEVCISGKIEVVQGEILVCVHYVPVDCLLSSLLHTEEISDSSKGRKKTAKAGVLVPDSGVSDRIEGETLVCVHCIPVALITTSYRRDQ